MSNVAAERPTDSRLLGVFTLLAGLVLLVLAFGFVGYNWTLPTYVVGCAVVLCGFGFFADFESAEKPDAPNIAEQRWATMADILAEDISDSNGGDNQFPYLGLVGGDNGGVTTLRYKGPRHLICYGPTRVGKSAAIIIPNLQNLRRSMIVTDPKGELAAITAAHRDKFGRVIVLNPFGLLIDKRPHLTSIGWNPLLQLDPESDDFSGDAMCIADAIIDRSGDGKSSFFENRAKEFFRAFIMHERITKGREASLYHLSSMLSRDLIKTLQAMALSENKIVGDAGLEFLRRKEDKNSQSSSLEDVIATIKANIYFLDDIRIGADMHLADAIDFSALHREIVTIYLILPTEKLEAQAKWLRLFVNLAIENLIRSARSDSEATVPPVLFMLDEFGSLGRLECIVKGLNMAASSRLQLFFFLQNVGQLKNSRLIPLTQVRLYIVAGGHWVAPRFSSDFRV